MSAPAAAQRTVAVALIATLWCVTAFASISALLSAYLGRANWGDGQDPDPWPLTVLLLTATVLAPLAAAWITRTVWRRTGV